MSSVPHKPVAFSVAASGFFALDLVLGHDDRLLARDLGGSAGNVLAILSVLGWNSAPIGELGADPAGKELMRQFKALAMNQDFVRRSEDVETPVVFQLFEDASEATHRFTFRCPACGRKRSSSGASVSDDLIDEVLKHGRPDAFYFDRTTPLHVKLAARLREAGAFVFFEPSAVHEDRGLFQEALLSANVVKYSHDRISNLDAFDLGALTAEICTLGMRGLRFRTTTLDTNWLTVAPNQVDDVIDTCGAGDWCSAGIIHHLFREHQARDKTWVSHEAVYSAIQFGQVLSALNCQSYGARGLSKVLSSKSISRLGNYFLSVRMNLEPDNSVRIREDAVEKRRPFNAAAAESDARLFQHFCCAPTP